MARAPELAQQEQQLRGPRELRRAAEAAAQAVERRLELPHCARERVGTGHRGRLLRPRRGEASKAIGQAGRRTHDAIAVLLPGTADFFQHRREARPPVPAVRRKVRAAVERLQIRREPDAHRPSARPGRRLHEQHVDAIHVGALLAVHLDGDEARVEHLRDGRVLERLVLHHVAPVAGRVADGQEDRLVLAARGGKRLLAPRVPVHGVATRAAGDTGSSRTPGGWPCSYDAFRGTGGFRPSRRMRAIAAVNSTP